MCGCSHPLHLRLTALFRSSAQALYQRPGSQILLRIHRTGCGPDHPTIHHRHEPLPPSRPQHHHTSHPNHPYPHLMPPYAQLYAFPLFFPFLSLNMHPFLFALFPCFSLHLLQHKHPSLHESPPFVTRAELHPNRSLLPPSHTIAKTPLTSHVPHPLR